MFIKDFWHDRKYRVMANGLMLDEQVVILGVPQGTVLVNSKVEFDCHLE